MAAVFPLDTTKPWVFNGVTYEYDASEDRWFVVSTTATDDVVRSLNQLDSDVIRIDDKIEEEINNRTDLINAAAGRNNAQDAAIAELDARVDSISENIGVLEFKGIFTYTLERSEAACNSAYVACVQAANGDRDLLDQCDAALATCQSQIGDPLADGTFTTIGTLDLAETTELVITYKDKNGEIIDWENVLEPGDYLELAEPNTIDGGVNGGDTVLYEVIADPIARSGQENIRVKFIKETGNGDGHFDLATDYTIRVFKKDLGIDINEADERYVRRPYKVLFSDTAPTTGAAPDGELQSGEFWFDTAALELFVWNNNSWVTASKPASQDIVFSAALEDIEALNAKAASHELEIDLILQDRLRSPHLYYSDEEPSGNAENELINGDLWIDSDDLQIKFYSQGAWINPDRTSDSNDQQLEAIRDSVFGRRFKKGGQATQPRDYDGYCWFGSNYLYVSATDLDNGKFSIFCDDFDDTTIRPGTTKHMITVCKKNSAGTWSLQATAHWPGVTDCRDTYIYIKDLVWTNKPGGWTTGGEYRIKVSPFW